MALSKIPSAGISGGIVQTGSIVSWSNSTIPSGFLECDGSAVSRTTYSDLFGVISTDYGSGDGSTTFNLPDLQDKTMVGASSGKAYSTTGGAESVSTSNHTLTTSQIPSHDHNVYHHAGRHMGGGVQGAGAGDAGTTVEGGKTSNIGSGGSHNHGSVSVMQPYMALKFMIKT